METHTVHDKNLATTFLKVLDQNTDRFTFQFISEDKARKNAEVFHGTLDEVWSKILRLNTPSNRVGVYVAVNKTDLKGRRRENIKRVRAHFVDADGPNQVRHCEEIIAQSAAKPTMVVRSSPGKAHYYWVVDDAHCDQFTPIQESLIQKFETDPAVKDLPRVMRLPGTLHLKDPAQPHLVTLELGSGEQCRSSKTLVVMLGLTTAAPALPTGKSFCEPFSEADRDRLRKLFGDNNLNANNDLSAGLETNIEEIRSAAAAIPPSAIATEADWMKLARGVAHEASIHKRQAEQLWQILDRLSATAVGYDRDDNRARWKRYINEAADRDNPITIGTVFELAKRHGWVGWAPERAGSTLVSSSLAAAPHQQKRAMHLSALPLVPEKREWLHGTDAMRGAVTLVVAPGARGKSSWLIVFALACASGRSLLGAHVFGGPLRVLVLSAEDPTAEVARRVRAAMQHLGLKDADLSELHIIGNDAWGLPLLSCVGNVPVPHKPGWEALNAELDRIKPDIIILDPLLLLMGGVDGNNNSAAAMFMGTLVKLAADRRMAVVVAHHAAKGRDPTSAESAMGAASFVNFARIALTIDPLSEKDASRVGVPPWEVKSIFRVLGVKQNFSPPDAGDRWFRHVSVELNNARPPVYLSGDKVAVVEPFQPGTSGPVYEPALVAAALRALDSSNPPSSPSKRATGRYAADAIAKAIAPYRKGKVSDVEAEAVLNHIMRSGLASVQRVKISRTGGRADERNGLVVTAEGRVAMHDLDAGGTPSPHSPQCSRGKDAGPQDGGSPKGPRNVPRGCGGNAGGSVAGKQVDELPLKAAHQVLDSARAPSPPASESSSMVSSTAAVRGTPASDIVASPPNVVDTVPLVVTIAATSEADAPVAPDDTATSNPASAASPSDTSADDLTIPRFHHRPRDMQPDLPRRRNQND